jgi:rubredoxin
MIDYVLWIIYAVIGVAAAVTLAAACDHLIGRPWVIHARRARSTRARASELDVAYARAAMAALSAEYLAPPRWTCSLCRTVYESWVGAPWCPQCTNTTPNGIPLTASMPVQRPTRRVS